MSEQSTCTNKRKKVTSAIDGMTVHEVRRNLDFIRKYVNAGIQNNTFIDYEKTLVTGNYNMQEFCLMFIMGHHNKRHLKSSKGSHSGSVK